MDDDLLYLKKNVLIMENEYLDEKEVTIAIELFEMLEENDIVNIILQIKGEGVKEIKIRRRD